MKDFEAIRDLISSGRGNSESNSSFMQAVTAVSVPLLLGLAAGWAFTEFFPDARKSIRSMIIPADDKEFTVEKRDASPAHFLSKIEYFSLFSKYGIQKYESREFVAGDYKWRLIIHPDGQNNGRDYISVHLAIADTSSLPENWEIHATFNIFLLNQISGNYLCFRGNARRFNKASSQWGFSKLISKESFEDRSNGYLIDDNCVFGAEVFVIKNQLAIEHVRMIKVPCQYTQKLKISGFSKLGNVWTSEEFNSDEYKWKIQLYPNGDWREKGRNVSFFLHSVSAESFSAHQKLRTDCNLILKGKSEDNTLSRKVSPWFTKSNLSWGYSTFMSIDDFHSKGYVVDDCCYLEAQISVQGVV